MSEKLKPCPFCGGSNLKLNIRDESDTYYDDYRGIITCQSCTISLLDTKTYETEKDAEDRITAIWNKRADVGKKPLTENTEKTTYFLKPCPFCGGNNVSTGILPVEENEFMGGVACKDCDMQIFSTYSGDDKGKAIEEAVAKWNDRSQSTLNELAQKIHDNAKDHGWWEKDRSFGDIIALCHSELSEALEEYRNGKPMIYYGQDTKPEGVAVEMIDCIIRILDWAGHENIHVDKILRAKHEYNKKRPYRHGEKAL